MRRIVTDKVTPGNLLAMMKQQDFKCAYTGVTLTPETASLDHIVPLSKGGEHCIGNVAIVHVDVNMSKSTLSLREYVELCRKIVHYFGGAIEDRLADHLNYKEQVC